MLYFNSWCLYSQRTEKKKIRDLWWQFQDAKSSDPLPVLFCPLPPAFPRNSNKPSQKGKKKRKERNAWGREDGEGGGKRSSLGYLFFFPSPHIFHLHTPGLRQIYKITLYMCFNMLVEGSEFTKNSSLNTSPFAAFNHNVFQAR